MDENLSRGYVRLGKLRTPHDFRFRNGVNHISPPIDKYNGIYFAMVLAGVGFLLPYNSFTIAVDYYKSHYPHTTIIFDMSLVYIVMAFFAVLANNFLVETLTLNTRITFGYAISCITLAFVAFGEIWLGLGGSDAGYTINLVAVAVVALGCTIQQSSFYGYTSMLPSRYTQAVMAGESAAGFLVSLNRIITKSLLEDEKVNTFIFFTLSVIIVGCCFFLHNFVNKSEFVQFYFTICQESKKISLEPTEDNSLMESNETQYGVLKLQSPDTGEFTTTQFNPLSFANPAYEPQASGPCYKVEDVVTPETRRRSGRWRGIQRGLRARWDVSKSIWPYMVTIGFAYFVTLCLYPGIESEIVSCHFETWMPVVIMAIFNASDLIGKILAAVSYDWSRSSMLVVASCRVFLIPLILLCAMPRGRPFISGEGYPMFFSMVLGLTNGLVGSIPMIQAPCKVAEEHRELAGNIMTLSYNMGLTAGSIAAYLLDSIIGPATDKLCDGFLPHGLSPLPRSPLLNVTTTAMSLPVPIPTLLLSTLNVTTTSAAEVLSITTPAVAIATTIASTAASTVATVINVTTSLGGLV